MVPARMTAMLAPAHLPEFDEAIAHWRSRPHGVDLSVIAGRVVVQDGQLTTLELGPVIELHNRIAHDLVNAV